MEWDELVVQLKERTLIKENQALFCDLASFSSVYFDIVGIVFIELYADTSEEEVCAMLSYAIVARELKDEERKTMLSSEVER